MNNPLAMMAAITCALLAVYYVVRRPPAPWYVHALALTLCALLFISNALGTPSLTELTGASQ